MDRIEVVADEPVDPGHTLYTFSVYITAPNATEDDGYDAKEIEQLLKHTLSHYNAPLNKERRRVLVDFELIETKPTTAPKPEQLRR